MYTIGDKDKRKLFCLKYSQTSPHWAHWAVPENIHTLPHKRDWNFLAVGGSVRPKTLKEMNEAY